MDEFGDIEARRDANVANLRRAFGALPQAEASDRFAVLLGRLGSAQGSGQGSSQGVRPPVQRGASQRPSWAGAWARAGDET